MGDIYGIEVLEFLVPHLRGRTCRVWDEDGLGVGFYKIETLIWDP